MARNQIMRVDIWQGDWGLPSVDIDCLQLLTYAKFAGLEVEVHKSNNPFRTPSGTLPVFHQGNKVFQNYEQLSDYVRSKNICPDHGLSTKQKSEVSAYTNMLKENLFPALQYIWWVDEKNHVNLTRSWYCKALPFPLGFYYPNKYLKNAQLLIEALYEGIENKSDIETKVYSEAEKCLTAISVRLGESPFMFGDHPTSIDATLYAYLAPLLKAPFPNNKLQNYLKACTNLYKFVTRITQRYYGKENQDYERKMKEETVKNPQSTSDTEFPNKRRNQVLAGIFAMLAMSVYALSSGMVQNYPVRDDEELNEPTDYDHSI